MVNPFIRVIRFNMVNPFIRVMTSAIWVISVIRVVRVIRLIRFIIRDNSYHSFCFENNFSEKPKPSARVQ